MDKIPFNPYDFFGYLASGLLVVVGMQFILGFPRVLEHDFKVIDGAIFFLGVYVAGQMIATPAKAILEDGIVDKLLKRPHTNLLRDTKPFLRGLLFPGFYKPLPGHTRNRILDKATAEGAGEVGEAMFLHIRYSSQIRDNDKVIARLNGFLNQYGFNRNLAFTSLAVGIALLVKGRLASAPELIRYGLTAVAAGIMLFYRYLKFFRQYSYELFNTYAH
jgi:hypothetical protein